MERPVVEDFAAITLWSNRTRERRHNNLEASKYRERYDFAMREIALTVDDALPEGRVADQDVDEALALITAALESKLLRPPLSEGGRGRARSILRYAEEAAMDRSLLVPWDARIGPSELLVLLCCEWSFTPFAEGVLAACIYQPSTPWVDVRSALHTMWWWSAEHCVKLGHALSAVMQHRARRDGVFFPFYALLDAVLDKHLPDDARRGEAAKTFARLAPIALGHVSGSRSAREGLILPALIEARRLGLAPPEEAEDPTSPEAIHRQVAALLFALEAAGDQAERVRLREQIGPLLDRYRLVVESEDDAD